MIKYNSSNSVLSPFNPILSLDTQIRNKVNEEFIKPIIHLFFSDKGGIENFKKLDADKLKTEIEFKDFSKSFVKSYLYKELMTEITKDEKGDIIFLPRYTISFDKDLTAYKKDPKKYPYKEVFKNSKYNETNIRYGCIRLANAPILYIIYIDLQEIIRFIKTLPSETQKITSKTKQIASPKSKRNKLISELVSKQYNILANSSEEDKKQEKEELERLMSLNETKLKGERGSLRVNLSWNTTDDLDLHIKSEKGTINYQNKILESTGSIGKLDVDANAGGNIVSTPQENINWDYIPSGKHIVSVDFFADREKRGKVPFSIFIENGDESRIYNSFVECEGKNKKRKVVEFEFKNEILVFKELE